MTAGRGEDRPRVLLVVLDGWGLSGDREGNAVALARTPVVDRLRATCPFTELRASGRAVGLPEGQMGNSEVGHLTIGAGRILLQDVTRIDDAIASGEFAKNPALVQAVDRAVHAGGGPDLHLVGLLSDGGVHSHQNHCFALLELAKERGARRVWVHALTDGRDTSPTAGAASVRDLLRTSDRVGVGALATLVGRYWGMDRDRRWDRTRVAWEAMTRRQAPAVDDPAAALESSYARGVTDEFLRPIVCSAEGAIRDGDSVVFFNFRADRGRQLARALGDPSFREFPRLPDPAAPDGTPGPVARLTTMTWYDDLLDAPIAFGRVDVRDGFGEVVSRAGLRQLRAAETEKYAHVTYFFNGGVEVPWPGEERLLVASPRVATYDLQPEMSAVELTERTIEAVRGGAYDAVVLNYANPDMVGHTGDLDAAIRAVEAVDRELGRLLDAFPGVALVIADHGNAEMMREPDGSPHTAHTTNPVPCLLVGAGSGAALRPGGGLRDVAPTLLGLLGLPVPDAMDGCDLRLPESAAPERSAPRRSASGVL
ncbi:MAG TPA: 2,3-bisphosphoglycerate-independent phosphoglycerate mutase [Gemmatimonadota bacterium]